MSLKELLVREVERLSELQHIADYLAFLKFQASRKRVPSGLRNVASLAALYGEFANKVRALAEAGIEDYAKSLAVEDTR